ncbi:hypothetical protein FRC00_002136 [Tulasnella sp. 408]|nr:hypothetical protein FRC00_002136 [Tulasnella sp. 408]
MSSATQKKSAWVVLITNPSYLPGLFVLHHSLRAVGTRYPLVVIATPQLSAAARATITRRGIPIRDVQSLKPRPGAHQLAEHDKRFEDTWTKLRITRSSPRPYNLLNSGLVVLTPSIKTYNTLEDWVHNSPLIPTFGFPDQDLLSAVFAGRWKPLPYIYNALKPLRTTHPKMWRDEDVKVVHYIMDKPWQARIGPGGKGEKGDFVATHVWWWDQYALLEKELNSDGPSGDLKMWAAVDRYVSKD